MSQSASTMMESLPPISRIVRLIHIWPGWVCAARELISRPTSFDPVNAMNRVFECSTIALPKVAPEPGQKFTTPGGRPASSSRLKKRAATVGASLDGFRMTVLPVTIEATVMPAIMAREKFHGGITAPTPKRDVVQLIPLAWILDRRRHRSKAQRLARVEVEKVDGLAHFGICLGPILANFVGQPCAEIESALPDQIGRVQKQRRALFDGGNAPAFISIECSLHGELGMLQPCLLMHSDHLRRPRRIQRADLLLGADAPAADDDVILLTELVGDTVQGVPHRACIVFTVEVQKRLISELARGGPERNSSR